MRSRETGGSRWRDEPVVRQPVMLGNQSLAAQIERTEYRAADKAKEPRQIKLMNF